jgi:hypothetical protein
MRRCRDQAWEKGTGDHRARVGTPFPDRVITILTPNRLTSIDGKAICEFSVRNDQGMKRRAHLDENVAAVDLELTPEELARLDAAFPVGAAAGERYTPEVARWAGR